MNDGGPAYPTTQTKHFPGMGSGSYVESEDGMSLRDWFAGMALQGWLASFGASAHVEDIPALSGFSYEIADAMIAERSKEIE